MTGRVLMVQGTSSSAGKSLLVAALCRIFARRGIRVAPFKAQNMSNNAAVCADGAEIGRSQALQAAAAGIGPTANMNPILLKPETDGRSLVVVNGRPWRTLAARDYFGTKATLWPVVTEALDALRRDYEMVVIEGAGSPAEMNLRNVEIVNMAVAGHCQAPVLLVGDIERGGVFAQLLGTLWLVDDAERRLVRGLIVNKFRGDVSLFAEGRTFLEERGGVPVLGVIPWLVGLDLPEEDAEPLCRTSAVATERGELEIVVIRLPRISNFDDFAPLAAEPGVTLRYVDAASRLGSPHAIILPGTKSTMGDLAWLRQTGLAARIVELAGQQRHVVGICGGYQMLGQTVRDEAGVESPIREMPGLGLLPTITDFAGQKETHQVQGVIRADDHCLGAGGLRVEGYEIHVGRTTGGKAWLELARRDGASPDIVQDGAIAHDGRVWGSYLHGLFANDGFRRAWLGALFRDSNRLAPLDESSALGARWLHYGERVEASLTRLADGVEAALDMRRLEGIVWGGETKDEETKAEDRLAAQVPLTPARSPGERELRSQSIR